MRTFTERYLNEYVAPPRPGIIVFAGTQSQADNYIATSRLDKREVIVASSVEKLHGLHNMPIVYYGTWYERTDRIEIEAQLNIIRGTV